MDKYEMLSEIKETPTVLKKLFKSEKENIAIIADRITRYKPTFAILSGRGSSDNACIYGQYVLEFISKIPVSLATGSIYTLYKKPPEISKGVIIGISQSGETDDVCEIAQYAESVRAMTIGITNERKSNLFKITKQNRVYMWAGKEKSVCATKSFSASLLTLVMLASYISRDKLNLDKIIESIDYVLLKEEEIKKITEKYLFSTDIVVLGTGFSYSIALETALKLRESCYINALGMSSVDFLHGPIAILTPTMPVMMFMPDDETLEVNLSILKEIKSLGVHVLVISDNQEALNEGDMSFEIPKNANFLYPFPEVLFSQLFAYHLSVSRKINPDLPRFLHKVTRVEF
jgi:glucosamine--fructose-6-phosphate aminotransferase (isomerizing)